MEDNFTQIPQLNTAQQAQPQKNIKIVYCVFATVLILVASLSYFLGTLKHDTQNKQSVNTRNSQLIVSITPVVTGSKIEADDNSWTIFKDESMGFEFGYPKQYCLAKPFAGADAPAPGSYRFYANSKSDSFFVDSVLFSGSLKEFVKKYTYLDSASSQSFVSLNIATVLGDLVNQSDSNIMVYKFINKYDQEVNPGGV